MPGRYIESIVEAFPSMTFTLCNQFGISFRSTTAYKFVAALAMIQVSVSQPRLCHSDLHLATQRGFALCNLSLATQR